MSFLAGMIRFRYRIADTSRNIYVEGDLKMPQHISDNASLLLGRFLVFAHAYMEGLTLELSESNPDSSVFLIKNFDDTLKIWIAGGCPSSLQIRQALGRLQKGARCLVYFVDPEDEVQFVHQLRGSKTNWVQAVQFNRIHLGNFQSFLEQADEAGFPSRVEAEVTIVDDSLFCQIQDKSYECRIEKIDIWQSFQVSIA